MNSVRISQSYVLRRIIRSGPSELDIRREDEMDDALINAV